MSIKLASKNTVLKSSPSEKQKSILEKTCDALQKRSNEHYQFLEGIGLSDIEKVQTIVSTLKKNCTDLIVIGIGGSSLGSKALINANNTRFKKHVHFFESPSPQTLGEKLSELDPQKTAVNIISKSGGTLETLAIWSIVEAWLHQKLSKNDLACRIVITTESQKNPLFDLISQMDCLSLEIPKSIGGRFSVFTHVGLLPLAFSGVKLEDLKKGIDKAVLENLKPQSLATQLALDLTNAQLAADKNIIVIWPYGNHLFELGRWFQQLWAESLGKKTHLDGSLAHVGSTPLACLGPQDQHSLLQLFADGPKDKLFLFVCETQSKTPLAIINAPQSMPYLKDVDLQTLVLTQAQSTFAALSAQKHPCLFLTLPQANELYMGELLMTFMIATVFAAALYEVDPFDQPGVELGKKITFGLLGDPKTQDHLKEYQKYLLF